MRVKLYAAIVSTNIWVGAQRDGGLRVRQSLPGIVNHGFRRFALGVTVCLDDHGAGNQAMSVVAQGVAMKRSSLAVFPLR